MIPPNNFWWLSRSSPCLHFPSKFEWSPLWILPKFSVIPPLGFSVTTNAPFCSPKNQVIPPPPKKKSGRREPWERGSDIACIKRYLMDFFISAICSIGPVHHINFTKSETCFDLWINFQRIFFAEFPKTERSKQVSKFIEIQEGFRIEMPCLAL